MTRNQDCGVVIMFLHDINDIFIDFSKLLYAVREQNGKIRPHFKMAYTIGVFSLPVTWVISRLYYFPLNGIYRASLLPESYTILTLLHILLQLIMVMNVIWSVWMCVFYYQVINGREVADPMSADTNKKSN
ncbi:unnamed protein product [Medioppia subpectinata]|uniref:TLC domain-containing protein n=1 Tax=Medioppia subpectinata TaxID=1979941 RepID=A0A7R9LGI5_9ACAR|nr:unnamed protein product [Medioppia subpectinata]CAG2118595.1 unnamed protein product [Medioppia subpectinata]